jgi:predicted negative regulator of RcsB-dependent stress response
MDQVEQTQSTGAIEFLAWLEVNKKRLITGAAIALGVMTLVTCYRYFAEQKEISASEALSELRTPIPGLSRVPAPTADKFLKIAADYSDTSAGVRALILGAEAQFAEGKYVDAQVTFEKFIRDNPAHAMTPQAALGIAASLDAQGKANEALTKYQEVSRQHSTENAVVSQAKLAIGRIYEAQGKLTQAHQAFRELADMGRAQMYNAWVEEAVYRVAQLEKAHPELVPPPVTTAPAMPLTTPSITPAPAANAQPKATTTTPAPKKK